MYIPKKEILEKYADVLINCALNGGNGIKESETVFLQVPEIAKPLLIALRNTALKAKAFPIIQFIPDGLDKEYYKLANQKQLEFFPEIYLRGKVNQADHFVSIIADSDLYELKDISPEKIMAKTKAFKPYMDWKRDKENSGKLTWTLALYGTKAMAKEANLTLEEYWNQIIEACYLNEKNPVKKWKETLSEIERIKSKLNSLNIKEINITSDKIDLKIGLDSNRKWMGGSGRNIPSFEVFISPDWRKTHGIIYFNQPLYRYGNLIKGIALEFKDGKVVKASAKEGEKLLKEMIDVENADKIGEFSLTDERLSKITKFMATTLFDENIGGKYGNTHIALGSAYKDSYPRDPSKVSDKEWDSMGYNDSAIHTDMISTENRKVTAVLEDNERILIYENGQFKI